MCFIIQVRLNYINVDYDSIIPQNSDRPLLNDILVKFTYLVGMIADQNFYDICFMFFLSIGYGLWQKPKFVSAQHLATAEGENCAYAPTQSNKHRQQIESHTIS